MVRIIIGIFIVLHGLVHLLYYGHSARAFELQPGLTWPDGSWLFSRLLNVEASRSLANLLLILIAVGLVVGGLGIFFKQSWWQPVVVGFSAFSVVVYILFWDGVPQMLDGKGGIGILINLAILAALLIFHWPKIEA